MFPIIIAIQRRHAHILKYDINKTMEEFEDLDEIEYKFADKLNQKDTYRFISSSTGTELDKTKRRRFTKMWL